MPCGELALGENCITIISDKPNSLGMFLGIQSNIHYRKCLTGSFKSYACFQNPSLFCTPVTHTLFKVAVWTCWRIKQKKKKIVTAAVGRGGNGHCVFMNSGGERNLGVGCWICNPKVSGSNLPPCHWMNLSSVAPNSTPPRFVNNQLVSLPPVGILNLLCLICIIFVCYAHLIIFTWMICAV